MLASSTGELKKMGHESACKGISLFLTVAGPSCLLG